MKFYLVDASGFLFRAYHAFPELLNTEWKNVNVVYGFFRILLKLLMEKPEYLVLTWDLPVPTERHKIDTDYKANRPAAPEDFKWQIPLVQKAVEDLGIPAVGVAGYEADDIIATLAKKFGKWDTNVFIISSDKDLKQLITKHVVMKDPMKWITSNTKTFMDEYGFEPKHMLDYLSLMWDSADNIKWVPWIGPKSASKLVQEYKTVENIYDNIDKIATSPQKKLISWKNSAFHSKRLVKLLDVPGFEMSLLKDYYLDIDIWKFNQVLVNNYRFDSMRKPLDELKNKLCAPTQNSLF